MFAPGQVPGDSPSGFVGAARRSGGAGGAKRRGGRTLLGTFAKSASTSLNGGDKKGFCKRARVIRTKKKERLPSDEKLVRLRRLALQGVSREILKDLKMSNGKLMFRVGLCLRAIVPVSKGSDSDAVNTVDAQYVPATKSSHYKNLQQCGSVWTCPCCSAKVSERRRGDLAHLIQEHLKACGSVHMVTHTIAHTRFDDLAVLLASFSAAQSAMKGNRPFTRLCKQLGIIGSVKALEVTWSPLNGWHVHWHTLIFSDQKDMDVDAYEKVARPLWKQYALKQGLTMNEHGFKIDRTFGAVQDYVLKFGHDPATDNVWGVESEMVKSHAKQGRRDDHYTHFGLLAEIYDNDRQDLKPIFREYAMCFKGSRQLTYSPGLKKRYPVEEKTDEELVLESQNKDAITLVKLEERQWKIILGNDVRGELLEAVRTGCPGAVIKFLAEFDIEAVPAPLAGLRVQTPDGVGVVSLVTKCPILGRWRCSVILEGDSVDRWRAFDLTEIVILEKEKVASQ